jgi:peptidoglycan/xylan/chitin deacetylase (PgdA/CDA1 family)
MVTTKPLVRRLARTRAINRLGLMLHRRRPSPPFVVPVLMYHRVESAAADRALDPSLRSATPEGFREQMQMLRSEFCVISSLELLAASRGEVDLPQGSVAITFDDAYASFLEVAGPVLTELRLSATMFVPTAFPDHVDGAFWWDRLWRAFVNSPRRRIQTPVGGFDLDGGVATARVAQRAVSRHVKTLRHDDALSLVDELVDRLGGVDDRSSVASWAQLRELDGAGVVLASHTQSHPILPAQSPARVAAELRGATEDLQREIGSAAPIFAYPSGQTSPAVRQLVADNGYEVAFSTRFGVNDIRSADWLELRRIDVTRSMTVGALRTMLHPSVARLAARVA